MRQRAGPLGQPAQLLQSAFSLRDIVRGGLFGDRADLFEPLQPAQAADFRMHR